MSDPTPASAESAKHSSKKKTPSFVIVRPYPKIVFMYPTMLFSLVAGVLLSLRIGGEGANALAWERTLALCFFATFAMNLLTIAFEFNRYSTVAIIVFLFAITVTLILLNKSYGLFDAIASLWDKLEPHANAQFYYMVFAVHLMIFIGVFIDSRFDYWEFRPNEILHKHGFLGDVKRYPAPGTQVTKEITDVLEYVLLLSGRLVIFPTGAERPIVLDNVIRINSVEKRVMKLLSALSVTVDAHSDRQHKQR